MDSLIRELHNPNPQVRYFAAQAISEVSFFTSRAFVARAVQPLIEAAAHDTDAAPRARFVWTLADLRELACPAVPVLLTLSLDSSAGVRRAVADAFGDIGLRCLSNHDSAAVLAALKRFATDSADPVQYQAVWALGQLGPAGASGLAAALQGADSEAAGDAAGLLGQLPPTPDVIRPLVRALAARRRNVRLEAGYALGGFGPSVRPELDHAAADRSARVRDAARRGIQFYEIAAGSPVVNRCFAVALGRWIPAVDLGADSAYLRAPAAVRFTPIKYNRGFVLDSLPVYRLEPLPDSLHPRRWVGYWQPDGDSAQVGWTNGLSGFRAAVGAKGDTLRGTATTYWDTDRQSQTAPMTFAAVPCP